MQELLQQIGRITGPAGLLTGDDVTGRSESWVSNVPCPAKAIVRPANTAEVSAVMKLCHAAGQTVVTHGGLTGLVDGAFSTPVDLVLSLERMRQIDPIDKDNRTVKVQAGAVLQSVHEVAEQAELMFPLDLGARGSATIGGNLSTNAGGNSVIRYGMAREQVLGIEAVLADGTVISSLNQVIKNNTGYDLKQLFIGSEGTLGIITQAVLRLRPLPRSRQTALVAIDRFSDVTHFLRLMDAGLGGSLSAFEVMWNDFFSLIVVEGGEHGEPLGPDHGFYVLLEATGSHEDIDQSRFDRALEQAFDAGLIADAVVAQSSRQREELWAIRDDIDGLVRALNPVITFDVSLGVAEMNEYVDKVRAALQTQWPQLRMVVFGHLGDGNIHLALTVGSNAADVVYAVEEFVYRELQPFAGIISAEHGIGLLKKDFLDCSRSPEEIDLMRSLKNALDPQGILNPGKVLPDTKAGIPTTAQSA